MSFTGILTKNNQSRYNPRQIQASPNGAGLGSEKLSESKRKSQKSPENSGGSGGARTWRARSAQLTKALMVREIASTAKNGGNAYIRPFEAKVGRKVVGKSPLIQREVPSPASGYRLTVVRSCSQ
jgi:hypothetical protein